MNNNQRPAYSSDHEQSDDISALGKAFSLGAFRYIDIARQERLAEIYTRWPLLSELGVRQEKEG